MRNFIFATTQKPPQPKTGMRKTEVRIFTKGKNITSDFGAIKFSCGELSLTQSKYQVKSFDKTLQKICSTNIAKYLKNALILVFIP